MQKEQNSCPIMNETAGITEETIVSKAIFAFFGHTKDYRDYASGKISSENDLRERLRVASRLAHKAIITRNFNFRQHEWISLDSQSPDRFTFPKQFAGIDKQLKKEFPAINSGNSKVFPNAFAAICLVVRDALTKAYLADDSRLISFRKILEIDQAEVSEEQLRTLDNLILRLREFGANVTPDWAVTYDRGRAVIRSDREKDFLSTSEAAWAAETLSGRYILYRKAFRANSDGYEYLREFLDLKLHPDGPMFHWHTKIGPTKKRQIIHGVVIFPEGAAWLIGHDVFPFPRLYTACLSLLRFHEFVSQDEVDCYVTGMIMSSTADLNDPLPAARTFLLKKIPEGRYEAADLSEYADFLTSEQISLEISPEEYKEIT